MRAQDTGGHSQEQERSGASLESQWVQAHCQHQGCVPEPAQEQVMSDGGDGVVSNYVMI